MSYFLLVAVMQSSATAKVPTVIADVSLVYALATFHWVLGPLSVRWNIVTAWSDGTVPGHRIPTNVTKSELVVWAMTIVTFLTVVAVSVLAFYAVEATRPTWGRLAYLIVDRRSGKRFNVSLPVFVYGHQGDAEPFFEATTVLQVSANGGLLTLTSNVQIGQELLLVRNDDQELHQPCRIARLGSAKGMKTEVAIKFVRLAPNFWANGQGSDSLAASLSV